MLALTVALVLGQVLALPNPAGPIFSQPSLRSGAFFEFAPASGAGMGTACACTTPTGAKGEAMTFTRTGSATCSPVGLATTGITNASLVECAGNLPRVESSGGVLGLRVEGARTNVLTRFIDYANATWADVATPTLTGAQVSPWTGTYANLAVQFDDNDAVAFEGRTQTVTVTAATQYVMSCFVKAGTLNTARLSLDGTTADFTGLSSTTWSLVTVTDASSSGVAIAAQALNGSTAAATGTVVWGGCQVEAGAYATSMIPTVAAGVTRNEDIPVFSVTRQVTTGSIAMSVDPMSIIGAAAYWAATDTNGRIPYGASNVVILFDGTTTPSVAPVPAYAPGTISRIGGFWGAGSMTVFGGSATASSAFDGAMGSAGSTLTLGGSAAGGVPFDGIYSRICYDPSPSRCR